MTNKMLKPAFLLALSFFCQGSKCHRSFNASFAAVTEWGYTPEKIIWFRAGYPFPFKEVQGNAKLKRKAKRYISDAGVNNSNHNFATLPHGLYLSLRGFHTSFRRTLFCCTFLKAKYNGRLPQLTIDTREIAFCNPTYKQQCQKFQLKTTSISFVCFWPLVSALPTSGKSVGFPLFYHWLIIFIRELPLTAFLWSAVF